MLSNYTFCASSGLPVACSEFQTLLPSDVKCSRSSPFKNTSQSSHMLCILLQARCGTGMQDPPEASSTPGSPFLRAHQWTQTPPGESVPAWGSEWGSLPPAGPKENFTNKWRQKRAPRWRGLAESVSWGTISKGKECILCSSHCAIFFCFLLCLHPGQFRSRWDHIQSQGTEAVSS